MEESASPPAHALTQDVSPAPLAGEPLLPLPLLHGVIDGGEASDEHEHVRTSL